MPTPRTFDAADTTYVESLFHQYKADEASVSPEWRAYFIGLEQAGVAASGGACTPEQTGKALAVQRYIQVWRARGHLAAWINPLQTKAPTENDELTLAHYGLGEADMATLFHTHGVLPAEMSTLKDIRAQLIKVYGQHVGIETMAVAVLAEREWVRAWWENPANHQPVGGAEKRKLYEGLLRASWLEKTLHTKFVGAKRFSVEGNDGMVPLLLRLVEMAAADGAKHMVLGMAHRGRLNVLCNIFHKPYADLFAAYADTYVDEGGPLAGDVKYHLGKVYHHHAENGDGIELELMFNPSHLEAVNPVVLGAARAKAAQYGRESGMANFAKVLPVLIHGDSAVAGQGVVAECNNLMALEPYTVGGTIHLVANNQVGFTADPTDAVSGDYCTDIFKGTGTPIVHVNADDIEACLRVVRFAWEYRKAFGKDAVIDLYGYRRWGHNEGDDPTFTQPLLYAVIKDHPIPAEVYKAQLLAEGSIPADELKALEEMVRAEMETAYATAKQGITHTTKPDAVRSAGAPATVMEAKLSTKIAKAWAEVPERFLPNAKVAKVVEERVAMLNGDKPFNWGAAETAAYASLLHEGITVRITGQDAQRGTFSHRHAVLTDSATGGKWSPMASLAAKGARCAIHNSALSENAVMGFEYGYAHAEPAALVIWEGQFGDFANGAQVMIDQFLAAAEVKWGQMNGLTLLLPHGQEGQGPEHSSARLERFLQLCGQNNMRVCMPSTPAQIFHLLRRQALWAAKRPLVVMTPKSLLRHPAAVSEIGELTHGGWHAVIDDPTTPKKPKRVVLCSGKVYYDLAARREQLAASHIALVRVEELYPWPADTVAKLLKGYGCKDVWWVQEEPRNMGAWWYVQENWHADWGYLHYAGRPTSASPAAGTMKLYQAELEALLADVFGTTKQKAA